MFVTTGNYDHVIFFLVKFYWIFLVVALVLIRPRPVYNFYIFILYYLEIQSVYKA